MPNAATSFFRRTRTSPCASSACSTIRIAPSTRSALIAAEPILAARVIGLANSVSYNPGGRAITELKGAISRLGFAALRAIAAAIVVRQMKEMSSDATHRALAGRLWEHTANVAALARHRPPRHAPEP